MKEVRGALLGMNEHRCGSGLAMGDRSEGAAVGRDQRWVVVPIEGGTHLGDSAEPGSAHNGSL